MEHVRHGEQGPQRLARGRHLALDHCPRVEGQNLTIGVARKTEGVHNPWRDDNRHGPAPGLAPVFQDHLRRPDATQMT